MENLKSLLDETDESLRLINHQTMVDQTPGSLVTGWLPAGEGARENEGMHNEQVTQMFAGLICLIA